MTGRQTVASILWVFLAVSLIAAPGCGRKKNVQAETPQLPQEMLQSHWQPQELPVAHFRRDYRLREGDKVEIIYHVRYKLADTYKIKIQDRIEVRFPFNRQFDQERTVQSDGTMHLDLIGAVFVYHRTADEIQEELTREYAEYLKEPKLTVNLKESNVKIRKLEEAIKTAPRG